MAYPHMGGGWAEGHCQRDWLSRALSGELPSKAHHVPSLLSLRTVEDLLHKRGICPCHESIRLWVGRFGPVFARVIQKRWSHAMCQHPQWRWHMDEVFLKTGGKIHSLWRAMRSCAGQTPFIPRRDALDRQFRLPAHQAYLSSTPVSRGWLYRRIEAVSAIR